LKQRVERCRICSVEARADVEGLYDDRYGFPGKFRLLRCAACGHRQLQASFTPAELETLYSSYYPRRELSVEDWRPHPPLGAWDAWFRGEKGYAFYWVPPKVRVLDVGCGFGQTLGYHRSRGCEVKGVEADANARRVAERFGFDIKIGLFDPNDYAEGSFDYVTLDQVIEHMTDPVETLAGVRRVLAPGGTAILSTPNSNGWGARLFGRRWINWHVPYHLQQFSRRSMTLAAERAGLRLERALTITSSEWLLYQWLHLLSFPQSCEPSVFWSSHPLKEKFLRRKVVRLARLVHSTYLDHWTTRFFDAVGFGDNQLFFLRKA
jgi:2-polyprenyl-3-methyl-5-hydroxy-6-metoxy-1,4-benzoquinol methylase